MFTQASRKLKASQNISKPTSSNFEPIEHHVQNLLRACIAQAKAYEIWAKPVRASSRKLILKHDRAAAVVLAPGWRKSLAQTGIIHDTLW